jgi:hypothetical protein
MLSRSRAGESIAAKEWTSVLGRLQSMQRSHGKIVKIMSRACRHALGVAVSAGGWEAQKQPQQDCMREMTFWLRYLKQHEGQQIQKPGKQVQVRKLTENEEEKLRVQQTEKAVLEQYSKEEKVYVFMQEGRMEQRREAGFKEDRGLVKDVIRELRTMQAVLGTGREKWQELRGGKLVWETELFAVAKILQKGAKNPAVQRELIRVVCTAEELGFQVEARWKEQVGTAWELEQKLANSTDEWGVERAQLAKVLGQLGVSVAKGPKFRPHNSKGAAKKVRGRKNWRPNFLLDLHKKGRKGAKLFQDPCPMDNLSIF